MASGWSPVGSKSATTLNSGTSPSVGAPADTPAVALTCAVDTPPARRYGVAPSGRAHAGRIPTSQPRTEVVSDMPIALSDGVVEWLRTSGVRVGVVILAAVVVS